MRRTRLPQGIAPWLPLLLLACGPALVPTPPAPAPRPTPVPNTPGPAARPVASGAARYTLPSAIPVSRYSVSVRVQLERDSAGRVQREGAESGGTVTLTVRRDRRGGLRGTGRVDGYTLRAGGALAGPAIRTGSMPATDAPLSVNLALVLDTLAAQAVVQPALANECDRPETAAAALARDLLVRVPDSVAVGDRWRDSLVSVVCRGGIPLVLRTTVESTLQEANTQGGVTVLEVRRSLASQLEGSSPSPWRPVTVAGEGRGTQRARFDAVRGTLLELEGESTLIVRVNGATTPGAASSSGTGLMQQVVQRVTLGARRMP